MCVVARTRRISTCTLVSMIILVLEDIDETRDGIEKLLKADGYRVTVARDETDAIDSAQRHCPNLILVSVAGLPHEVIATAHRVRLSSAIGEHVPVVVFCIDDIGEGDEVAIGRNVHLTRPDNFNQLRGLLSRLLTSSSRTPGVEIREKEFMTTNKNTPKPFIFRFIDTKSKVLLELTNQTEQTLKSIEILTVFLKDEQTPGGGPSQSHIRVDAIESMRPKEKAILSHRTWINGKPADADHDQLERLRLVPGEVSPYVLDISWDDAEGKSRFHRIPVGH
jgi:CheY-like chemotaxis protein